MALPVLQIATALAEARCAINQGLRNLAHANNAAATAVVSCKDEPVGAKVKEELLSPMEEHKLSPAMYSSLRSYSDSGSSDD